MTYHADDDTVTLTMTRDDYATLMVILGWGTAKLYEDPGRHQATLEFTWLVIPRH